MDTKDNNKVYTFRKLPESWFFNISIDIIKVYMNMSQTNLLQNTSAEGQSHSVEQSAVFPTTRLSLSEKHDLSISPSQEKEI